MPAMPRTWPSRRPSRFSVAALVGFVARACLLCLLIRSIYPPRVYECKADAEAKMSETHDHSDHGHSHGPTEGGVLDPVCGMTVDPHTAKPVSYTHLRAHE